MKTLTLFSFVLLLAWIPFPAWAQQGPTGGQSSEWEATGFNNGRRIVRDSNGYFHAFWHSQTNTSAAPSGSGCDIFYQYTLTPAAEPPSMAAQGAWSPAYNMTVADYTDARYPSVAIEYDDYDGAWQTINDLHIVWQGVPLAGSRYEVYHASLAVSNPPTAPAGPLLGAVNLSNTPSTDSLVPAIAINQYVSTSANQSIHVVWQEEDIITGAGTPGGTEDTDFSDIAYIRSVDSGVTWTGPGGGWAPHAWDNLSLTTANAQMPTISCELDQYTEPVATGKIPPDLGYNSNHVHVAWNQDLAAGAIHILYTNSGDNGVSWAPPLDVSTAIGSPPTSTEAYPSIGADMLDNPHLTWIGGVINQAEPLRTGPAGSQYSAGLNPSLARSFPGPDVGMYGALANYIVYGWSANGGIVWTGPFEWLGFPDNEFPTVAFDRWQHVTVNWQGYMTMPTADYEIISVVRLNGNPPPMNPPIPPQLYGTFSGTTNDSNDNLNDDLLPNYAHKKVAMYMSPMEPNLVGYDEVWTKVVGHGAAAAVAPTPKDIWQKGNMTWVNLTNVEDWMLY